ncbi:hypothetical protein R1A27_20040 [Methylobacterium sp. NMS12]|uniref:hypothetical protein n=1 Tax=Methylobacterium sp. NMS12 TaxID=3079766 RepID=UPI003F8804C7
MHFEIRPTDEHVWTWVLLDEAQATVVECDRTFPSEAQASAAALAFSQLVTRAGKELIVPTTGNLL